MLKKEYSGGAFYVPQVRNKQWDVLNRRRVIWGSNWCMAGDFNEIRNNGEKWGGRNREDRSFRRFNDWINENQLMEINIEGHPWTWSNEWEEGREIREKLDRILVSQQWKNTFDQAKCIHVHSEASDHAMLLIDCEPGAKRQKRRFTFDKRWLQYGEIEEVIKKGWQEEKQGSRQFRVGSKIKACRIALLNWNRKLNLNSKKRIMALKQEIEEVRGLQQAGKRERIRELKKELNKAYKDEESYWQQKSRNQWLKEGDKNTSFFHAAVTGRRKRNTINSLQKRNGDWCINTDEIEAEITNYYT